MPEVQQKPVSWLHADSQVRKSFDEAELRFLGKSLKRKQIHPVIARPDGTIIDGERRWRAAQLVGLETLEVIITDAAITPAQITEIQLVSALHRVDLTGPEKWQASLRLLQLHPEWKGKDLAEQLHLDPSMVTRLLSPSRCIKAGQKAFVDGLIGVTDCYAMSRVDPEEQAAMLALKLNGASRDALERQARKKRNGSSGVKINRLKISLVSGTVITISGKQLSLEDVIDGLTETLKAAKKAASENLDGKTWQAVMRDKAATKPTPISES